ncbi:MAG: hypothetical protein JRG96_15135 [Deltaproteobacteria bacterium]|nr:hypothetical protein [Deltaproteobacteria bacterium]MBW2421320.1 hypothetical protein [Deltaproteobacteria bacterium]
MSGHYADRIELVNKRGRPVKHAFQQATNIFVLSARLYRELAVSALSIIPALRSEGS